MADEVQNTSSSAIGPYDVLVLCIYFLAVIAVGLWSMFKANRGTVQGYFLASRLMSFLPVGMSLFASNIGSEHFIGLAGSGSATGIGVGAHEYNALFMLQMLGFFFIPVYLSSGVCTLPEYLQKRYGGGRLRVTLALLSILIYIFTKVSVNLYSGALFIQQSVGWDLYSSIMLLLSLTALCTVTGGLAAVMYLDTMMSIVMLVGSTIMTIIAFDKVGGYSGLRNSFFDAIADGVRESNSTCGIPPQDSFVMLRDPFNSDIPWFGFLVGHSFSAVWYWCADQVIVQRALASRSLSHAQAGCVLAGFIKVLPLFVIVMPGMISRVLYPNEVGCVDPEECYKLCENRSGCTNIAFPKLVLGIMPTGLRGLMLAVVMAALMSDLTSIFNSAATLFTIDIWMKIRKMASTKEQMVVGRCSVLLMCAVSICWVPVISSIHGGRLFVYIQAVSGYLGPPIAVVYLMGMFWSRANETGAFYGLLAGEMVGVLRIIADSIWPIKSCGETDDRPIVVRDIHYMYVALIEAVLTAFVCVVLSTATERPTSDQLVRVTYWTRHDSSMRSDEIEMQVLSCNIFKTGTHNLGYRNRALTLESNASEHQGHSIESVNQAGSFSSGRQQPFWQRMLYLICGISDDEQDGNLHSKAVEKEQYKQITSIRQNKYAKLINGLLSLLCMGMGVFLYIYFSIPDGGPTSPTKHSYKDNNNHNNNNSTNITTSKLYNNTISFNSTL